MALVPNGPLVGVGQIFTSVRTEPLTAEDLAFIYANDFAIVIVGRTQYQDLSNNIYTTDFCYATFITGATNDCGGRHNEVR